MIHQVQTQNHGGNALDEVISQILAEGSRSWKIAPGDRRYDPLADGTLNGYKHFRYGSSIPAKEIALLKKLSTDLAYQQHRGILWGILDIDNPELKGIINPVSKNGFPVLYGISENYEDVRREVLTRAQDQEKHDGAFIFDLNGTLRCSGVGIDPWPYAILRYFGARFCGTKHCPTGNTTYSNVRERAGLNEQEGRFRLRAALMASYLFPDTVFGSISEDKKVGKSNCYIFKDGIAERLV